MRKSAWTFAKTNKLLEAVKTGSNKSSAFAQIAKQMGLRPDSVRNFYYSHAKNGVVKRAPKFTNSELRDLLRTIILGYSRGESVRGICLRLADGNRTKMLRFQNKYRQILAAEPLLVSQTVAGLEKEGYIVKSPLPTLKFDNVLRMPAPDNNNLSDQDIMNLFMGLVRLVRKQGDSQIEKLRAEIERLKRSEQQTTNK